VAHARARKPIEEKESYRWLEGGNVPNLLILEGKAVIVS
jgi:hypothetical protein